MVSGLPAVVAIAATIGQGAAVLLGILGVLAGNFILALIAVFAGERYLGEVSREDLSEALSVLLFERRRLEAAAESA